MVITVVGGDVRQCYLASTLVNHGFDVRTYDLACDDIVCGVKKYDKLGSALKGCDAVVLPTPVSKRWHMVANMLREDTIIFGWNIPKKFAGFPTCDFGQIEDVAVKNAIATAEGTIAEAIKLGTINISGSTCLVTGYGRCAREIALRLRLLGAYVTVAARNVIQRETASFNGFIVSNMFEKNSYSEYDFVINTIPADVITPQVIDKFSKNVVIIDIASAPGGTDFSYCRECGIRAVHSLSLPGIYSPKTSGEILGNVVIRHLTGGV